MLKNWQRWAYFSQWIIAAGAIAQLWQTSIWLHLPHLSAWLYVFVFTSTLLLYLFHFRFWWQRNPVNDRQHFFAERRTFLFVEFIAASILLVVSFFKTGIHYLVPISLTALGAGAYTYFIYKPRRYGIFKYNGLFKIITLTFVWTAVTALLPVAAAGLPLFTKQHLLYYFLRWLFMLSICLPFDVRDMQMDGRRGNMTVPVLIGAKSTYWLCYVCLLLCAALPFFSIHPAWYQQPLLIANMVGLVFTWYCIYYSSQHVKDDFSWFLLDSSLVIRAAIIGLVLML